jgi:DNA-binding transcriptional MocR family regulator
VKESRHYDGRGSCWRKPSSAILSYGDPAGYLPPRRAIFEYIAVARGIKKDIE